jgi:hypothetical protein
MKNLQFHPWTRVPSHTPRKISIDLDSLPRKLGNFKSQIDKSRIEKKTIEKSLNHSRRSLGKIVDKWGEFERTLNRFHLQHTDEA